MSYFTRRLAHFVALAATTITVSACGGSSESASDPVVEPPATTAASPSGLLSPEAFDEFLRANPDAPLVNVHIPYQQHLADTDAFIAFDEILDSGELPDDRSTPIALYCRSGNMSGQAAADLAEAGYASVVDLAGGMNAWADSGRELLDDPTAAD